MAGIYQDVLKRLGVGAKLLSEEDLEPVYADSGSPAINWVMSGKFNGGVPAGSVVEYFGESSSAKTVFVTHVFVGAQNKDFYTALIDNEHAYHPGFARGLGVDASKLIYLEPLSIEDCFDRVEKVVMAIREDDKTTPIYIGFDSIGTPPTQKELDGEMGGDNMTGAIRAKAAGICLRRVNSFLKQQNATLMIINQVRTNVGQMFGDNTAKAGGGKSLDFYCTISNKTRIPHKGRFSDELGNPLGVRGRFVNTKNKHSIPYRECDFELLYDKGLTRSYGLCEIGIKLALIESTKKGWYFFTSDPEKSYRKAEIEIAMLEKIDNGELE